MIHRPTILIFYLFLFSIHFVNAQPTERGGKVIVEVKSNEKKGNTYALLIGINYSDRKNFSHLNYAVNDARLMRSTLLSGSFLDSIPEDHIRIIEDKKATSAELFWNGFTWLKEKADTSDKVIIYFAGHGIAAGPDLGFLIAYDAPDVQDPSAFGFQGGAIPISQLKVFIKDLRQKRVTTYLITDACRNNEKNNQSPYDFQTILESNQGEIQFSSCSKNQSSLEDQKWGGGHGLFTYYFIKGLSGFADDEGFKDGKISLFELQNYVTKHVGDDSRDLISNESQQIPYINIGNAPNPNQTIAMATESGQRDQFREGNLLATAKRSMRQDSSELIKEYLEALTRKSFFPEEKGNAYDLLQRIRLGLPDEHYKEALQDYMICLLNDAQSRVNKYFEGFDTIYSRKYFSTGVRELNTALGFMSKDHPLYRIYTINRLFLEAHTYWGNYLQYDVAIAKIDSAIGLDPSLAYLYNAKGLLAFDHDKCEEANAAFTKAHDLKPEWWFPIYNLTRCMIKSGELAPAKKIYHANLHSKDSVVWYNLLGAIYKKAESFDSAAYYYRKAIQHNPKSVLYINNYGDLFMYEGKYDSALRWYRKALAVDTASVMTRKSIALVYMRTRQYEKARSTLNEFIKIDSTDLGSWMYFTGLLQYYKRDYDSAAIYFEKSIPFDPNNLVKQEMLGDAYLQSGKSEQSRNVFISLINQDPIGAGNYANMADWYNYNKYYDSATLFYRKTISMEPNNSEWLRYAGENFYDNGEDDSARFYLHKSLEINNKNPYIYNALGNLAYVNDKNDSAAFYYRKSIKADPNYGTGWLNLGTVYQKSKKKQVADSAIFFFKKATVVTPYNTGAFEELAKIYESKKQFAMALSMIRQVCHYYPNDSDLNIEMASLFFEMRRYDSTLYYQERANKPSELFGKDRISLKDKNEKELRDYYRAVRKLKPAYDSLLLVALGDSYYLDFEHSQPDSFVRYYKLLMEKYQAPNSVKEKMAKFYEDNKQPEKADSLYESMLASDTSVTISLGKVLQKEIADKRNNSRIYDLYTKFLNQAEQRYGGMIDLRFGETQIRFNDPNEMAAYPLAKYFLEKNMIQEYIALNKKMVTMGYFRESKGYFAALINGFKLLHAEDSVKIYSDLKNNIDNYKSLDLAIKAREFKDDGKYDSALQLYSKAFTIEQELLNYFPNFRLNPLNAPGLVYCFLKMNKPDNASIYIKYCNPGLRSQDANDDFEINFALVCYYTVMGDRNMTLHYINGLFEALERDISNEQKKKKSEMAMNEPLLNEVRQWPEWKEIMKKNISEKD